MSSRRVLMWGIAFTWISGLVACGPITAVQAIQRATVAVESARVVDAERYAIYEYVSAVEYLRKAKEEEAHSDFQAAVDLARRARELADKAHSRAMEQSSRGLTGEPASPAPASSSAPPGSKL